jgi:pimeloyl-ACP methyl ester carboxylesterase
VGSRSSARWRRQAIRSTMRRHGRKLAECRESALVLHGDAGQLLRPAAARAYRCPIPGARLVILPGVGHHLPRTVWRQVRAEMRALADRAHSAAMQAGDVPKS